jgi:hypothetical protein
MNGGTEARFSTISLERLQCARRDSADPTEKKKNAVVHVYGETQEATFADSRVLEEPLISAQKMQ